MSKPFSFKAKIKAVLEYYRFYNTDRARWDKKYPADRSDWVTPADAASHKVWTARFLIRNATDCAHLERMADHPDIDGIAAKVGVTTSLAGFFLREILQTRGLAEMVTESPADTDRRYAELADDLARYLRGSQGLPPPLPSLDMRFVTILKQVAGELRAQADRTHFDVSREDTDSSQARGTFMRELSDSMLTLFGKRFADQVAELADLAFPRADDDTVSVAQDVYDARRREQRRRPKN